MNKYKVNYQVASVDKVSPPAGGQGGDWYRYVLVNEGSRIIGLRPGTSEEVMEYAMNCAEAFNLRSAAYKEITCRITTRRKVEPKG